MPPRIRICSFCIRATSCAPRPPIPLTVRYASIHAPSMTSTTSLPDLLLRYPPTQPPSHRPPETRKSQLHRQYASLLRSTPLLLLFQHNNLKATELMGVRRELAAALRAVDARLASEGRTTTSSVGRDISVQIIRTGVFAAALRVVEFFDASAADPGGLTHGLSRAAHDATVTKKLAHALAPLLSGPLAVVSFPEVSTEHLKAALSVLAPRKPDFPAPSRRAAPGYYDAGMQAGVQKLILLGARVDGRVFDMEGTRWLGKIEGGRDGLRAQLVQLLQSVGAGITNTLEGASRSLYLTVEGRRGMMEEEEKDGKSE